MKRWVCLILIATFCGCAICAAAAQKTFDGTTITLNNGYKYYKAWSQDMYPWRDDMPYSSTTPDWMNRYGCCVVAMAKMIVEAGLQDPDTFNPGTLISKYGTSSTKLITGDGPAKALPEKYGFKYEGAVKTNANDVSKQVLELLKSDKYYGLILFVETSGGTHFAHVDREKTLEHGVVYINDSMSNDKGKPQGNTRFTEAESYWTKMAEIRLPYTPIEIRKYSLPYNFTPVDTTERVGISTKLKTDNTTDDQCYIKATPFEDGKTIDVIDKGGVINIIGAVKNKHENIWYKTEDGHFVYSGDVTVYTIENLFPIHAVFKNLEKCSSRIAPYSDSAIVNSVNKDAKITVKKFVVNSHGNIWAQLDDDSYLCFYDAKTKEQKLSFVAAVAAASVANPTKPTGNLTKGNTFAINGVIATNVPLLTVSSHIINRETNAEASGGGTPVIAYPSYSSQKVNINSSVNGVNINLNTMFSKLAAGWYRYELRTQYGFTYNDTTFRFGDSQTLVSSDFSVNKAGETFDEDVTTTPTEYSTLFTLDAKFTYNKSANSHQLPYADSAKVNNISSGQLVTVKQFVTNQYGNIWVQLSDNSFVCFHDMAKDETYMTFNSHVTQPTHSTTYPTGNITVTSSQGFWLKGPVEAKVPFLTVSTRIVDRMTGDDVTVVGSPVTVSPAATVRKLELWVKNDSTCLDSRTLFRKLAGTSGWYTYQLNVQFGFKHEGKTFKFGNEVNLVTSDFTVNNPTGEEPPAGDVQETVTVTLVNITNTKPTLMYGESHEFQCQVFPSNATDKTVTWSSSDENVLKLLPTETGAATVCYVGCGVTTITATANDGSCASHSYEVTVIPKLNYTWGINTEALVGRSTWGVLWLTTEPASAEVEILSWDESIVQVKSQETSPGEYEIELIGVAPGTAYVAAQAYNNACWQEITVRQPVYVESIDIYGLPNEMKVGETADLYFVFNPENHDCDGWGVFSSDTSVAEVLYGDADWDENGNFVEPVIARASGQVTIRVEAHDGSGVFATHTITVKGSVLFGDANEDGVVNAYDALLVLQYSAGWNVTPNKELADANGDGVISIADALQILKGCVGGSLTNALRALQDLSKDLSIDLLEIKQQPTDQTTTVGQTVEFTVSANGASLRYQWYIDRNDGKGWCKLNGAARATYDTSMIEIDNDGYQYKCVITDAYGNEVTSDVAVLHVLLELPVTGDASAPGLWLALCVLSALGIVFMNKKRAFR